MSSSLDPRGLVLIDTRMSGRTGYTSVFLVRAKHAALLDAGVSLSADTILAAAAAAGVPGREISYLCLTHAHYDHAGGAHALLARLREQGNQEVRIVCAEKPAVYLGRADLCEKLMAAGKITEGGLAGDMAPINRESFLVLGDGNLLDLGGLTIRCLDAPGHANGHLLFHVPELGFLFAGDACGLLARAPDGTPVILPTAFAPEYRHEPYLDTLRKVMAMPVQTLGFGHFGTLDDPGPALEQALHNAQTVRELAVQVQAGRLDRGAAVEEMEARFGAAALSLYPSPERARIVFKSMIAGNLHDLERDDRA